jgi:5'(3')-deoxyribonucleotidase
VRIAVDLDGVCYEFQRTYRYMIGEYRGVAMPPVSEFWTHWDAQKDYGRPADHRWMWDGGVRLGLFRYGHMVQGARRGLEQLAEDGHELLVVTSRPAAAVLDTVEWISLFFKDIPLAGIHILSNQEPKSVIRADLLIDDRPENIYEWSGAGREAILFEQPWNAGQIMPLGVHVAQSWKDVVTLVRSY